MSLSHATLPASGGFWQSLILFGLQKHDPNLYLHLHVGSPCVHVCLQLSPYKDTSHIGFRIHPSGPWPHANLADCICNEPISK